MPRSPLVLSGSVQTFCKRDIPRVTRSKPRARLKSPPILLETFQAYVCTGRCSYTATALALRNALQDMPAELGTLDQLLGWMGQRGLLRTLESSARDVWKQYENLKRKRLKSTRHTEMV